MLLHADMLCGIGGFRIAAERIGVQTVVSCDLDTVGNSVYSGRWDGHFGGDIRDLTISSPFDILTAGLPYLLALADQRVNDEVVDPLLKIINTVKPKIVLLEVMPRHVFNESISDSLAAMGYNVQSHVPYPPAFTGFPFIKLRRYFLATLFECEPWVEMLEGKKIGKSWHILEPQVDESYYLDPAKPISKFIVKHHLITGMRDVRSEFPAGMDELPARTLMRLEPSYASWRTVYIQDDRGIRRLTPRETMRLNGFPDDYAINIPDQHAYRLTSGATVIPVAAELLEHAIRNYDKC